MNEWMNKQNMIYPCLEYYSAMKKKWGTNRNYSMKEMKTFFLMKKVRHNGEVLPID